MKLLQTYDVVDDDYRDHYEAALALEDENGHVGPLPPRCEYNGWCGEFAINFWMQDDGSGVQLCKKHQPTST